VIISGIQLLRPTFFFRNKSCISVDKNFCVEALEIFVSVVLAQVYVCKIDGYLMQEIRECYVGNSPPSGVVFSLLEEGSKKYIFEDLNT
jgi:hypothetical protein